MYKLTSSLGEDEEGMTVHDKLDYIIENGGGSGVITSCNFSIGKESGYNTRTYICIENLGFKKLTFSSGANYRYVYSVPRLIEVHASNESVPPISDAVQIGNRNDTEYDITGIRYVLIAAICATNNNSGYAIGTFTLS